MKLGGRAELGNRACVLLTPGAVTANPSDPAYRLLSRSPPFRANRITGQGPTELGQLAAMCYHCVHNGCAMQTTKVGIREFRENLSSYLESKTPVAITRHGATIGIYVPTKPKAKIGRASCR